MAERSRLPGPSRLPMLRGTASSKALHGEVTNSKAQHGESAKSKVQYGGATKPKGGFSRARLQSASVPNSNEITAPVSPKSSKATAPQRPALAHHNARAASVPKKTAAKRTAAAVSSAEAQHGGKKPLLQTDQTKRKIPPWDTKALLQQAQKKNEALIQERDDLLKELSESKEFKEQIDILKNDVMKLENELSIARAEIEEKSNLTTKIIELESKIETLEESTQELKDQNAALMVDNQSQVEKVLELRHRCTQLEGEVDELKQRNSELGCELKESKEESQLMHSKLYAAEVTRKKLHNQIQDLKGNIRVFCRVRPPLQQEVDSKSAMCEFRFPDEKTLEIMKEPDTSKGACSLKNQPDWQDFSYDRVFPPRSGQEQVFHELEQLVQSVVDGYNVCVFAYGQTGSGKTFTMEGGDDSVTQGMVPRSVESIFHHIDELRPLGWEFEVKVSLLEIYNEEIRDLLNYNSDLTHDIRLVNPKSKEVLVTNLTVEKVETFDEVSRLLAVGKRNRFVAATVMNNYSSRSHAVTMLKLTGTNRSKQESCVGTLNLIDLAGSERFQDKNENERKKESNSINKSLTTLGQVILNLSQKLDHIPYRNSKLTYLLQPSLGGNSKTLMLVNVSPLESCRRESLNSLRFAARVNTCKVPAPVKRQVTSLL